MKKKNLMLKQVVNQFLQNKVEVTTSMGEMRIIPLKFKNVFLKEMTFTIEIDDLNDPHLT